MKTILKNVYVSVCTLFLIASPTIYAGFGKGFAAGAGTFFGVSLLSNAIASSNQPRTVVYNTTPPVYVPDYREDEQYYRQQELQARREDQERAFAQQAAQLNFERQRNEQEKLALERERLDLERRKIALQEKTISHQTK